ncbi:hypothetical protein [Neorhodopirellula lusitana]|uniref:hypothetical protein n=1 Tax=Neorhodopirellula lusitana TaxID=445327 RepID=UPI00384D14B1
MVASVHRAVDVTDIQLVDDLRQQPDQGAEAFYWVELPEKVLQSPDVQWSRSANEIVDDGWHGLRSYITLPCRWGITVCIAKCLFEQFVGEEPGDRC